MTYLTYNNELRTETESSIISNLKRKGWVEIFQPSYNPETEKVEFVNGSFVVIPYTPEEIAQMRQAQFPDATPRQIRTWLIQNNVDPDSIPSVIQSIITDPVQQKIALVSWEYSTGIARDNPLTVAVSSALGFTSQQLDSEWPSIIAL